MPKEYFIEGMEQEVKAAVEGSIKTFEGLGARIVPISLPHTEFAVATYYIICTAEASSNLARYDGVKYGMRVDGKDIIDMYKQTRSRGLRERGQEADHPRHVRPVLRLLRRVLQEGRPGENPDKARFRQGF